MKYVNVICKCKEVYPIVLQYNLTEFPLVCTNCNLDAEKAISLFEKERITILNWNNSYGKYYKNWLKYDVFDPMLIDSNSEINILGLQIVEGLNKTIRSYYWWFVKEDEVCNNCPKCKEELIEVTNKFTKPHKVCDSCRILIHNY